MLQRSKLGLKSKAKTSLALAPASDRSSHHSHRIHRTVFRFGTLSAGHFGCMVLGRDGNVQGYRDPNEARYIFDGESLSFLNASGEISNRLRYYPDANSFMGTENELYLLPMLCLDAPVTPARLPRPVLINSIPKSGTYFIEAALAQLGGRALRLHLTNEFYHDWRGVPDALMHRDAGRFARGMPAGMLGLIMQPGEIAVAHLNEPAGLDMFAAADVAIIHCVRGLRAVLISLCRFKQIKVMPISDDDAAWRELPPPDALMAFLQLFANGDIWHIAQVTKTILSRNEPRLRYEDAIRGHAPAEVIAALGGADIKAALTAVKNQPTSTYSGKDVDYSAYWSDAAERFFQQTELADLHRRLGYT